MSVPDFAPVPAWVIFGPDGTPLAVDISARRAWTRVGLQFRVWRGTEDDVPGLEREGYRCVECRLTPVEETP